MWLQFKVSSGAWGGGRLLLPDEWRDLRRQRDTWETILSPGQSPFACLTVFHWEDGRVLKQHRCFQQMCSRCHLLLSERIFSWQPVVTFESKLDLTRRASIRRNIFWRRWRFPAETWGATSHLESPGRGRCLSWRQTHNSTTHKFQSHRFAYLRHRDIFIRPREPDLKCSQNKHMFWVFHISSLMMRKGWFELSPFGFRWWKQTVSMYLPAMTVTWQLIETKLIIAVEFNYYWLMQ